MSDEPWHLDKRVNVSLIATFIIQTAIGVWWAASLTERQAQIEFRVAGHDRQIEQMQATANAASVSLGRIEENINELRSDIARLVDAVAP